MKILFSKKSPEQVINDEKKSIFCFFNLHNIWWIKKSKLYSEISLDQHVHLFPDGKIISRILGIPQERGPSFTKRYLKNPISIKKKHFFLGLEKEELSKISEITKIPSKQIFPYHSEFTKNKNLLILPPEEVKKISSLINKHKSEYVWLGISSPKQEFIANQLFDRTNVNFFICIGAGKDFLLKKKKESPRVFTTIGLEWLYRLMTDFKHSKQKVLRSFLALFYIITKKVELRSE